MKREGYLTFSHSTNLAVMVLRLTSATNVPKWCHNDSNVIRGLIFYIQFVSRACRTIVETLLTGPSVNMM